MDLDRLSALPDCLLSLILAKLPIRDAIQCSVLSNRWRYLYTEMPDLFLYPYLLIERRRIPDAHSTRLVEKRISKILMLHSSDLKYFYLCNDGGWRQFRPRKVTKWLRCVARKNVEALSLQCLYKWQWQIPSRALFSCSRLTKLTLSECILTTFPTNFSGFKHLIECSLISMEMTDDSLARFVSYCPLLLKFKLQDCVGLQRPVISAHNLTNLYFCTLPQNKSKWNGVNRSEYLTVNCPNIKTLDVIVHDLRVNGTAFYEFSSLIGGLDFDSGSNLIELSLFVPGVSWQRKFSVNRFLELVGTLTSLKVLRIECFGRAYYFTQGRVSVVIPLLNLLSRLPNLERFQMRGNMILEKPEGDPMPPTLIYPLDNLQVVDIKSITYIGRDAARVLALLGSLLEIAPQLKEVKLPPLTDPEIEPYIEEYKTFLENWESLKKCRELGMTTEKLCEVGFCL